MRVPSPTAQFALVGVVVMLAVGGAAAIGFVDGDFSARGVGQDDVRFEEAAESCGVVYETSGDSDGSADGGVAVADVDRDGWQDLLAVGGDRPVLFANTGSGFERSGRLPAGEYPPLKTALFFDGDGDDWADLLLVPRTGQPIYLENRDGSFHRAGAGFDIDLDWGTGATAADYDGDGDLDVFVTQNGDWRTGVPRRNADGEATDGFENVLFENTEDGFERVEDAGVAGSHWTLAASFLDLTDDGRPDIHVANDYGRDVLLVNRGDGTFDRRVIPETNRHAMSSVVRDVNGDGHMDVFVTNIRFENPDEIWAMDSGLEVNNRGNTLLVNRGNGTFTERAEEYGVDRGGWGWAAAIEDFDNDGTLDLVHTTKSYLVRNDYDSLTGVETTPAVWEGTPNGTFERRNATDAGFVHSNGRGLATLDYDRDGDRDVVVADTSARFKLYENVDDDGHWLQVHVESEDGTAIGTRVRVDTDGGESRTRIQSSRSDFFSQSTRVAHVGLGPATVERLTVVRPDGTEEVFEDVETDRRVRVTADGSLEYAETGDGGC